MFMYFITVLCVCIFLYWFYLLYEIVYELMLMLTSNPYKFNHTHFISSLIQFPPGRSDRYSHEFMSDEEDGGDNTFHNEFENFGTVTPRMSVYLDENFKYVAMKTQCLSTSTCSISTKDVNNQLLVKWKFNLTDVFFKYILFM